MQTIILFHFPIHKGILAQNILLFKGENRLDIPAL
jgi:hypothetical protein